MSPVRHIIGVLALFGATCVLGTAYAQPATASTNPGGAFSPALPLNLDTCAQTAALSQYLDTIAPNEVEKLKEIRTYLEGCQKLLEERVITIKTQIEQIEAQETERSN